MLSDDEFDLLLPYRYQTVSELHWTPTEAIQRIAENLSDLPFARFLDVGSGAGKVCLNLAMATSLEITGVEQREALATLARSICEKHVPGRVQIRHGNMMDLDWSEFDVFYLYNPFSEHTYAEGEAGPIDRKIELDHKIYCEYIEFVSDRFHELTPGKRVITFHGYGGVMPKSMRVLEIHKIQKGLLKIWES